MNKLFIAAILCLSMSTHLAYSSAASSPSKRGAKRPAAVRAVPYATLSEPTPPITLKSVLLELPVNFMNFVRLGVVPNRLLYGCYLVGDTDHVFDPISTTPKELTAMVTRAKDISRICDAETTRLRNTNQMLIKTMHSDWTDFHIIGFIYCFLHNFRLAHEENLDSITRCKR